MLAQSPFPAPSAAGDAESSGSPHRNDGKVHVALGKSVAKGERLLLWSFQNFRCREVVLLHVHRPSPTIPTLLGNVPVQQAADDLVAAHRREEKMNMKKLLHFYTSVCRKAKVKVSIIAIENAIIQEGLVELIKKHEIRKLVMGTLSENFKARKRSNKAVYMSKNAPPFCEMWFIFKNKHVGTREVTSNQISHANVNPHVEAPSLQAVTTSPDGCINDIVSLASDELSAERNGLWSEPGQSKLPSVASNDPCLMDEGLQGLKGSIASARADTSVGSSIEEDFHLEINSKDGEDNLVEDVDSEKQPNEESNHEKVEESSRVAKTWDRVGGKLETAKREKQKLLQKTQKDTKTLQKTKESISILNGHAQELAGRYNKLVEELELIQGSIMSLKVERHIIQQQREEARHQLEWWKHNVSNIPRYSGVFGFIDESSDFIEFSLSDLQAATCDFSESFKIGHGSYGCVYKGEMLDRSVAIKKLHTHYRQGQIGFQNEVHIVGELKHPHLVTMIGACVEAWSIVCEYMPNGNLQDQLFRRARSSQWSWKDRVRVVAEISSALLYMHSFKPEMVIHGDLKPENVLLDSNFRCKISDFGIGRLAPEDTMYSPSFRQYGECKGEFSYKDPEYQRTGRLTPKSDVYSFGLIILQLLTGRSPEGLASEVWSAFSGRGLSTVLDMSAGKWPWDVATRLAEIGLRFCAMNPQERPELTAMEVREFEQLQNLEEKPVPDFFLCPILQEIMHDPQVAADGFTYEGQTLRDWIENGRDTSPMTNLKLEHLNLTPNHTLRSAIQDWLQSN